MKILSSLWKKMKDDPGGSWAIGALGLLIVGKTLVYILSYIDEDAYYEVISQVDLFWISGIAICMWISVWYFYLDRERRHRTLTLWLSAVAVLLATSLALYLLYR